TRIAMVETTRVPRARFVGLTQPRSRRIDPDALPRCASTRAPLDRTVETDVERPRVVVQHERAGAPEDHHSLALREQATHAGLDVRAHLCGQLLGIDRRGDVPARAEQL